MGFQQAAGEVAQQGLVSSIVEGAGGLVGHEFDPNTLETLSAMEASAKDVMGLNGAALALTGSGFLGAAGPFGAIAAGGMNVVEGIAGLADGKWNQGDWGNAGRLVGGGLAVGAGAAALTGAAVGGVALAPYLAAGAATIGLGMRGNSFMNEHLGYGFGDAMGYGEGTASHGADALSNILGLEEDSFARGALGVAGGVGDVGLEMLTNPIGSAIDLGILGMGAGLGIAEDVVNFGGGLFGNAHAGDQMSEFLVGEGTLGNSILDGASAVGDLLSPNQWAGSAVDWMFGD